MKLTPGNTKGGRITVPLTSCWLCDNSQFLFVFAILWQEFLWLPEWQEVTSILELPKTPKHSEWPARITRNTNKTGIARNTRMTKNIGISVITRMTRSNVHSGVTKNARTFRMASPNNKKYKQNWNCQKHQNDKKYWHFCDYQTDKE